MTTTQPTTDAAPPALILIVPEHRLEDLPAIVYAGIQTCAAAYHAGRYYVTVPHALYATWPVIRREGVPA